MDEMIVLAGEIAFRPLDLDDAGAPLRPGLPGQIGRGHRLFDGNDEHAFEI
ncbi:MAG: hypothetical protein KL863_10735 [Rhizobium sp.]|nr:hypothetical protein [Rhizobium sp.]